MTIIVRLSNRPGDPDDIRVSIVSELSRVGIPLSRAKEYMETWISSGVLQVTVYSPRIAGEVVSCGLTFGFKNVEIELEASIMDTT